MGESKHKRFEVVAGPLSVDACQRLVSRPEAGAVALFVGTVRNHNQGQDVARLEYEAYASMAEKEMARIAEELLAKYVGVQLACQHRVGLLEVGDAAVVCAASAAHRGPAFSACREFIDCLKARVPVWKREHGQAGPYWVGWEDARVGAEGESSSEPQR